MNSIHSIMDTSEVKYGLKYPDHCMPCIMYKQARESRVHQNEEIESLGYICIKKIHKNGKKEVSNLLFSLELNWIKIVQVV